MEILVRGRVEEQFLEELDAVTKDGIDHHDQPAVVGRLIVAYELLTLVTRCLLREEER